LRDGVDKLLFVEYKLDDDVVIKAETLNNENKNSAKRNELKTNVDEIFKELGINNITGIGSKTRRNQ